MPAPAIQFSCLRALVLPTKSWAPTCLPRFAQVAVFSPFRSLSLSLSHTLSHFHSPPTLTDTLSLLLSAVSDQHPSPSPQPTPSPHLLLRRHQSLDIEKQLYRPIFSQNSAASAPGSRNSSLGGGGGFVGIGSGGGGGSGSGGEQPPLTPTSISVPPEIRRGSGGATQFCQGVRNSSKPEPLIQGWEVPLISKSSRSHRSSCPQDLPFRSFPVPSPCSNKTRAGGRHATCPDADARSGKLTFGKLG